jgi:transcriptional regulator with XRE-family HTH domain
MTQSELLSFGEYIRHLRVQGGWSIKEAASSVSIDASLLGKIERNERVPTRSCINRIAIFLGETPEKLIKLLVSDQISKMILSESPVDVETLRVAQQKIEYQIRNTES